MSLAGVCLMGGLGRSKCNKVVVLYKHKIPSALRHHIWQSMVMGSMLILWLRDR